MATAHPPTLALNPLKRHLEGAQTLSPALYLAIFVCTKNKNEDAQSRALDYVKSYTGIGNGATITAWSYPYFEIDTSGILPSLAQLGWQNTNRCDWVKKTLANLKICWIDSSYTCNTGSHWHEDDDIKYTFRSSRRAEFICNLSKNGNIMLKARPLFSGQ
tara:strand:+ start:575 stop:1054 length:480 start_codon:yes stop_codon:yes gene_type:complete